MAPEILYDLLALREAIFVVEQTCIYHELDGLDKIAQHLLLKHDDDVIACLRLLPPFEKEPRVRIGRVAVSKKWRKQGIARVMIRQAVAKADAQTYLQGFYLSLGFETCGDEFLEDGIPHIPMQLPD
jgi:ElaA protein